MDDKLVAQNPRDSLIVMRKQNLDIEKAARAAKAKESYLPKLKLFSAQFLRADLFDSLSPLQKKELDKMCASFCRRRAFFGSLPYLGSLGLVLYYGFLDPMFLLILFPWAIISFIMFIVTAVHCEKKQKIHLSDVVEFFFFRRRLQKAGKLEETFK